MLDKVLHAFKVLLVEPCANQELLRPYYFKSLLRAMQNDCWFAHIVSREQNLKVKTVLQY